MSLVLDCPQQWCALVYKKRRNVHATQSPGHPLIILPQLFWWPGEWGQPPRWREMEEGSLHVWVTAPACLQLLLIGTV